jgi:hypothetical protein
MLRPIVVCLLGWLLLAAGTRGAFADGGTLRASRQSGEYRISVFSSPTPLRAGPVDVSVLVQDAATGEVQHDLQVEVQAVRRGRAAAIRRPATTQAATNKLFHAAQFDLPDPGRWNIAVSVDDGRQTEQVQFAVEAAEPLPPWQTLWPWFTWPALVIVLFALRRTRPLESRA